MTRDEKEEVRRTIRALLETKTIEPVADGKYRLSNANRETFEGVVDMTPSGAFYVQVEGLDQDIYVSGRNNDHVLNGDRVKVVIIRPAKGEMHPEGEVVEIVAHPIKNMWVCWSYLTTTHSSMSITANFHTMCSFLCGSARGPKWSKSTGQNQRMARHHEKIRSGRLSMYSAHRVTTTPKCTPFWLNLTSHTPTPKR